MKFLDATGITALVTRLKTYFARKSEIPTKVSDLTNDLGFVTSSVATLVTQEASGSSAGTNWRPLAIGLSSGSSETFTPSTVTAKLYTFTEFKVQPKTGTLKATIFKGNLTGNVTGNVVGNVTGDLTGTASGNVESCHGSASAGGSVAFNIGNGFRGVLVVQGASSTTNGMYMVWASGSGAITSYEVRAASSITFSNTTGKMTITAPSSTGIHCMWYITNGTVSVV